LKKKHGDQIRRAGYRATLEFVEDVAKSYSRIYQGKSRNLILAKRGPSYKLVFIELEPAKEGAFYGVKNAFPSRVEYLKNKNLLWRGAQSLTEREGAPPLERLGESIETTLSKSEAEGKAERKTPEGTKTRLAVKRAPADPDRE